MIVINTVSNERFSLNGIEYLKNFLSFVYGDKVGIYNAYDKTDQRVSLDIFSNFSVNGTVYASAALLQSALLNVIYTRDTLGAVNTVLQGSVVPTDTPTGTGKAFWIATQAGTYTDFGGVIVAVNSFAVISRDAAGAFSISQTPLVLPDGKIKPFINQAYPIDSQVNSLGKDWYNTSATAIGEIPGTSSKWVERLNYAEKEVGINKINPAVVPSDGSGWIGTDGNVNDLGILGMRNSGFHKVDPSKPYLLSGCGTGTGFSICLCDINKTYISTVPSTAFNTVMPLSFNTTSTTAFVHFTTQFNSGFDYTSTIMLEQTEETIPSSYTPYSVTIPKSLIPKIEYPNVYETQLFNLANVINDKFIGLWNGLVVNSTGAVMYRFEVDNKLKYFIDLPDSLNFPTDGYRGFVVFNSAGSELGRFWNPSSSLWVSSVPELKVRIHKYGYKIDKLPSGSSYVLFNLQVVNVNNWADKTISVKAVDYAKKELSYSYGGRYLSLGDSITHRDTDANLPTIGYQNEVNDAMNFSSYTNLGVSGMYMKGENGTFTSSLYVSGITYDYMDYDLVTILIGTNDFGWINTPIGTIDSIDLNTFYGSYNKLLEYIFASNPKIRVVIMTPPQRFDINQTTPNGVGHNLLNYATAVLNVANKWGVECLDLYGQGVWNFHNISSCTDDDLHGNDFGNKILGKRLLQII